MKVILERNLDFRQFQNLIILIFCCTAILLGLHNSLEFQSIIIELVLFVFIIFFFTILLTKKGLYLQNGILYKTVFLYGFVLIKNRIPVENYEKVLLLAGRLSTNYNYSKKTQELHNWEPDLNVSVKSFLIVMTNESLNLKKRIIRLTKPDKVKIAIDFIVENTNLVSE